MAEILSRLKQNRNQLSVLDEWLKTRPKKEREEWLEALRRADLYPTSSIHELLRQHGLTDVNENAVIRYRKKLEGYVSSR